MVLSLREREIIVLLLFVQVPFAMQRVGSGSTTSGSTRPRKEKRFSYVLNDADDTKVCWLLPPSFCMIFKILSLNTRLWIIWFV